MLTVSGMEDPGLQLARQAAGGKNADIARLLGITESAVSQWKVVPPGRAIEIEAKTAGKVTRYALRPDYFGAAPTASAVAAAVDPAATATASEGRVG